MSPKIIELATLIFSVRPLTVTMLSRCCFHPDRAKRHSERACDAIFKNSFLQNEVLLEKSRNTCQIFFDVVSPKKLWNSNRSDTCWGPLFKEFRIQSSECRIKCITMDEQQKTRSKLINTQAYFYVFFFQPKIVIPVQSWGVSDSRQIFYEFTEKKIWWY